MLRESNSKIGTRFQMHDVTGGVNGETDIPHAGLLSAYAEAVYHRDSNAIGEMNSNIARSIEHQLSNY